MSQEIPSNLNSEARKKIDYEALLKMLPDDRINFLKGSTDDYSKKLEKVVDGVVRSDELDDAKREMIVRAFMHRVQDHLNSPGTDQGGCDFDHLPQLGIISEEQYFLLNASAAGLAGKMIEEAGFPEMARFAYQKYGKMMARRNFG